MITIVTNVKCDCGHTGRIKWRENDTPYSGSNWESVSIDGLNTNGKAFSFNDSAEDILSDNKISCPECNRILTKKNIAT